MARPTKQGLDYFSLDTNIDTKLELFEAEHGLVGFGFIIKLFQKIYSNGYYYEWNEDEQLLFSKQINVDINQINVYINSALKRNIVNKELFEKYSILTSRGIQKRFLEACRRRKQIEIIKEFSLIDFNNPNYQEFKSKIVYVSNNSINVNNNSQNDDNNSQSKVNESKGKEIESKTNENNASVVADDEIIDEIPKNNEDEIVDKSEDIKKITNFWNNNIGLITPFETEVILDYLTDMEVDLIILAIKKAIAAKVRTLKYIEGILKNWKKDNIKTILEAEQADEKFKNKNANKTQELKGEWDE